LWRRPQAGDGTTAVGLYRADNEARLDALLADLPLADWLRITVTPLEPHPNDPPGSSTTGNRLPDPRLAFVYRLEAVLGDPLDSDAARTSIRASTRSAPLRGSRPLARGSIG